MVTAQTGRVLDCDFVGSCFAVATAANDASIKLWDLGKQMLRATLLGHTNSVSSVNATRDKLIVSGSRDGVLRVWDCSSCESPNLVHHWKAHSFGAVEVHVAQNNQTLAVSNGCDANTRLWCTQTATPLQSFPHACGAHSQSCAISDDGNFVASCEPPIQTTTATATMPTIPTMPTTAPMTTEHAAERGVVLWDSQTGKMLHNFFLDNQKSSCVSFAENGGSVVAGFSSGLVCVFDCRSTTITRFHPHTTCVHSCGFVQHSHSIVTGGGDGCVAVLSLHTASVAQSLIGHRDPVRRCRISPEGTHAISCGSDRTTLWCLETGSALAILRANVQWEQEGKCWG